VSTREILVSLAIVAAIIILTAASIAGAVRQPRAVTFPIARMYCVTGSRTPEAILLDIDWVRLLGAIGDSQ